MRGKGKRKKIEALTGNEGQAIGVDAKSDPQPQKQKQQQQEQQQLPQLQPQWQEPGQQFSCICHSAKPLHEPHAPHTCSERHSFTEAMPKRDTM